MVYGYHMRQHSSELTRLTSGYLHRPLDMAIQPVFSSCFSILSPRNHKTSSNTRKSSIPSDLLPNCQSRSTEQNVSLTQSVLTSPCCPNDHCSLSLCDSSTVHLPGPMLLGKTASAPEVPLRKPGISAHSPPTPLLPAPAGLLQDWQHSGVLQCCWCVSEVFKYWDEGGLPALHAPQTFAAPRTSDFCCSPPESPPLSTFSR